MANGEELRKGYFLSNSYCSFLEKSVEVSTHAGVRQMQCDGELQVSASMVYEEVDEEVGGGGRRGC